MRIETKKVHGYEQLLFRSLKCYLCLLDALNDSDHAIQLDEKNIKAYLRKGIALYNQNSVDEALKAFVCGLEIDGNRMQAYIYIPMILWIDLFFFFSC